MQNLFDDLEKLLTAHESLIDEDRKLIKNAVIDRAARLDPEFLKTLLSSDTIRAHFFVNVEGTLIFDKVKFAEFVSNKAFLPDSYTAFRNRIGLTDGQGRYLKDSRDVVLAWPYKDCVLEGGMTKEDAKRDEIFWNTTLAPDDITRLFEPKALTGFERWDAEAVAAGKPKPVGEIGVDDNLLIKGNNLLALHSLKTRYAGKIKLIYIDPPYNTGGDGFKYNDRFNHSAWLTFMRNRLEVAKELLRSDGAIFINLDDNEAHYAKVLMDEVFGRDFFIANVIWQKRTSPESRVNLGAGHDHIIVFGAEEARQGFSILPLTSEQKANYRNPDNDPKGPWTSTDFTAQGYRPNQMYEIQTPGGVTYTPPEGRCWGNVEENFVRLQLEGRMWFGDDGRGRPRVKSYLSETEGTRAWTWWPNREVGHNQEAKRELISLVGADWASKFTPKPERLLERVLNIGTKPGDIVLDFFLGSGTTCAVAHKMGRRWIGVDQMDYVGDVTMTRLKKVIQGEEGGVSKVQNWRGGGSFVYLELAEWNEVLGRRIREAADDTALERVIAEMRANGYWRYSVDEVLWDWDAFAKLDFDERKQMLLDALDANHLYVNFGDIADAAYGLSAEDVAVNRAFYEGEA